MFNSHRWIAVIAVAALLIATSGCNDDKKSTDSKPLINGDENSEQFEALEAGSGETLEVTGAMLNGMFTIAGIILSDSANPNAIAVRDQHSPFALADSSYLSLTKSYRSGTSDWKVELTYAAQAEDGDTITLAYVDSMKFFHGNTAVQWPDSAQLTKITNGMSLTITEGVITKKAQHGGIFGDNTWTISGAAGQIAGGGDVVISGNGGTDVDFSFTVGDTSGMMAQDAQTGSCEGVFEFGVQINNLALNLTNIYDDGCPESGSIHFDGDLDVACTSDQGNFALTGGYTLDLTATGDSTFYTFRNSTTEWEYHESCGSSETVSGAGTQLGLPLKMSWLTGPKQWLRK